MVQAPEGQTTEVYLVSGLQAWLDQGCHCLLALCLYLLLPGVDSTYPAASAALAPPGPLASLSVVLAKVLGLDSWALSTYPTSVTRG